MDDPDLPAMSSIARELLAEERARGDAPASAKRRSFARVSAAIATGGATALASGKAAVGAKGGVATKLASVGLVHSAVAFIVGAAIGSAVTAAILRGHEPPAPATAAVAVETPKRASAVAGVESAVPHAQPAPPTPMLVRDTSAAPTLARVPTASPLRSGVTARPHAAAAPMELAPPPEATPPGPDRSLAAERTLLDTARMALARKDADGAIGAAREHESRFPHGQLRAEREAILVQALVAANRGSEALERAEHFRRIYPNSVLTPVVESAVEAAGK